VRLKWFGATAAFGLLLGSFSPASAQQGQYAGSTQSTTGGFQQTLNSVLDRLETSEQKINQLQNELDQERTRSAVIRSSLSEGSTEGIDEVVQSLVQKYQNVTTTSDGGTETGIETGYVRAADGGFKADQNVINAPRDGFFIRSANTSAGLDFEMLISGRMQFRHTAFSDDGDGSDDRSDFEIERGRLIFRGHFFDPALGYFVNVDADTDDNHDAKFHDAFLTYSLSDKVQFIAGKAKLPGSRDWLMDSKTTRFADRSAATTFFRPDRSVGVGVRGNPTENTFYSVMLANNLGGYNNSSGKEAGDFDPGDIDTHMAIAATAHWDIYGNYGSGYSDLTHHEDVALRIGNSISHSDMDSSEETSFYRLIDGTEASDTYAGGFDIWMYSIDAGMKYQGWSLNTEFFFRFMQDFDPDAAVDELNTYGAFTEAGYFIIPETVELMARVSRINDQGGSPSADEYAAGANLYLDGYDLRLTFDVSVLDGTPADNRNANYRTGDDGVMFRTQLEASF
jgi:flagellar hook-basal body complex protein FliE